MTINTLMNRLYDILPDKFYSFESDGVIHTLKENDIIHFESNGHYIDIVTKDYTYKHRKNISTLAKELDDNFCQSHRTVTGNINYVKNVKDYTIYLKADQTLPLSKSFEGAFKKAYFNFHLNR